MAVVRILKGSTSFSALDYNSDRIKRGEAELLTQKNFPRMSNRRSFDRQMMKQDLRLWSASNSRIKNSQLHVSISVKGRELNKKELQAVGEKWLELMGYSNNPYCIFFHRNTRNNHIHIVTTRIGTNGRKIKDSFEKERAVKALDAIMGVDRTKELRKSVAGYLRFSFASKNQLFSILENNGFRIRTVQKANASKYQVFKNGRFICELDDHIIEWASERYLKHLDKERKQQIKAILIKYANKVNSFQSMNELLRKHHGLNLVMYGGKNGKDFYGFAVIDYKNNAIYKGSEFLSLSFLSKIVNQKPATVDEANFLISSLLSAQPFSNMQDINKSTRKSGFYINKEGLIISSGNIVIGELSNENKKQLHYNDMLRYCNNKYKPITSAERIWVASHYHVSSDDLRFFEDENLSNRKDSNAYYESLMDSMLNEDDFGETLKENNITFSQIDGERVFYDAEQSAIFSSSCFSPELDDRVEEALSYGSSHYGGESSFSAGDDFYSQYKAVDDALKLLLPNTPTVSGGGMGTGSDDERKKKRKKK